MEIKVHILGPWVHSSIPPRLLSSILDHLTWKSIETRHLEGRPNSLNAVREVEERGGFQRRGTRRYMVRHVEMVHPQLHSRQNSLQDKHHFTNVSVYGQSQADAGCQTAI